MGRKFLQEGETMPFTAPSGGVTADLPVLIGALVVIPANSVAQGLPFEGATCGVYINMPKAAGAAWAEGQLLYWDTAQSKFVTAKSATACRAAVAAAAAAADATTGTVRLNGVGAPLNAD